MSLKIKSILLVIALFSLCDIGLCRENQVILHEKLLGNYEQLQKILSGINSVESAQPQTARLKKLDGELDRLLKLIKANCPLTKEEHNQIFNKKIGDKLENTAGVVFGEFGYFIYAQPKTFEIIENSMPHFVKLSETQIKKQKSNAKATGPVKKPSLLVFCLYGSGNPQRMKQILQQMIPIQQKNEALNRLIWQYSINNQSGELPPESNWYQMIKLLLKNGADIESRNEMGQTPLMAAINGGNGDNIELAKLLITKGADVNAKDSKGLNVIDIMRHPDKFQKMLLDAGAKSAFITPAEQKEMDDIVKSNQPDEISKKVLPKFYYSKDADWALEVLTTLSKHKDSQMRIQVIKAIPLFTRFYNDDLIKNKVTEILQKALKDEDKNVVLNAKNVIGYVNQALFWNIQNFQKRKKDENYVINSGICSIKIPNIDTDFIDIQERIQNPGITQDVQFIGDNGWVCVLVITKIRADLPKDDRVLDRVEKRFNPSSPMYGKNNLLIYHQKAAAGNKILGIILKNADYNKITFPYGMSNKRGLKELETLSISNFIINKGFMLEIALFMKNDQNINDKAFIDEAKKRISGIVQGVKIY